VIIEADGNTIYRKLAAYEIHSCQSAMLLDNWVGAQKEPTVSDSEFNVNEVVASFLDSQVENLFAFGGDRLKKAGNAVRLQFRRTYAGYLQRLLDRYSRGKSFFVRAEPIPLYDFFVPLDLASQLRELRRPGIEQVLKVSPRVILTGTGGSGKSMMMRHLLLDTVVAKHRTPIFIELRHLADDSLPLEQVVFEAVTSGGLKIDQDFYRRALEAGHFCLMLDGFDELRLDARPRVTREIDMLAVKYPDNALIVSSRPDDSLAGWHAFTVLQVSPLDLERAIELVAKIPFDDEIKARFIADLQAGLFTSHGSLLSNPLLLSIMVLTYHDVASIPTKRSIFYNQAYEALFQKHDALKGGFQRERRSGLDIEDFARAFAALSLQSYSDNVVSFTTTRALEYIEKAKAITGLAYANTAVLGDAVQAVCLLVDEGQNVTYAHRSFQEYFVARFMKDAEPVVRRRLIDKFRVAVERDAVMSMLYEIDPVSVEQMYVMPALEHIRESIGYTGKVTREVYLKFLRLMADGISLIPEDDADDESYSGLSFRPAEEYVHGAVSFIRTTFDTDASWPESSDEPESAFEAEYGFGTVETEKIALDSAFLSAMINHGEFFGAQHLEALFAVEDSIKRKHRDAAESLESILAASGERKRKRRT
jgi:hypothetical protein